MAACRANPLATTGGLVIVVVAAFCFIGPLLYHTDQTHVFLSQANLSPRPATRWGPTMTAWTSWVG